jgi:arylsulfatase A-like enzyme
MPGRPNILWIITTQWRGQACGFAGDPNARTPCLDLLAAEAATFPDAVTPHPFGPFARAALLTGIPSPENGVRDYFDPLPPGARTVAHALGAAGYSTAFFGKWHLGRRDPAAPLVGEAHARTIVPVGERGGFALWEGFEGGFLLNDPWLHGTRLPEPRRFPGYQSDVVCDRAIEWLAGERAPAFCVVSLEAPHPPYDAPAAGAEAPDPAGLSLRGNVPPGGQAEATARRELSGYYAHIAATDRAVGRLAAAAGDSTAVVFTSVHGDMHGSHGLFRKGWPHEESIRIPLVVRGAPAGLPGSSAFAGASLIDLPRWALLWAGLGAPPTSDAPGARRISMPSVVALPHQCDRAWRGVRTADRKLVLGPDGAPWLYFDLAADPLEESNLAADPGNRAQIAQLQPAI